MPQFEERRAARIAKNKALFEDLGLNALSSAIRDPPAKRRKLTTGPRNVATAPTRTSARIATIESKPANAGDKVAEEKVKPLIRKSSSSQTTQPAVALLQSTSRISETNLEETRAGWTSWKATEPAPTRDEDGTFHFESDPDFVPNLSPEEVLHQGAFGGTYFRPLFSKTMGITIEDDWRELPESWIQGLSADRYLTGLSYDAEVNKYGVVCGQTIEEWEANGWIRHEHDVRGWFQWYCRYFQGRRCADDDRQISRWKKCAGERGRWRRTLLKKYQAAGIRSVIDEADDSVDGLSPAIHQTLHHWALEIRQHILDMFWEC
jgi:hypothetical protein